jgi:hypothetical protein
MDDKERFEYWRKMAAAHEAERRRWRTRTKNANARIQTLEEGLLGLVEAAVTGEDCCPFCEGDLTSKTPHVFGCQVGYAVTLLAGKGE